MPLGEDSEAYEVDIFPAPRGAHARVRRSRALLYAAADELADFGAPQTSLTVRVAQLSATVGRGIAADRHTHP